MTVTAKQLRRAKGRAMEGGFFAIPHVVMNSPAYLSLSPKAVKLFNDLGEQYRGKNNGALVITWEVMQRRGWKSKQTLENAQKELEDRRLIVKTRQGGRHWANYWAFTFRPIDPCDDKLEVPATRTPRHDWKHWKGATKPVRVRPKRKGGHVPKSQQAGDVA